MIQWDEKKDIVIVGSGAAGLSAAIEAAKVRPSVIVFEKMKLTGGNTRISDGGLSAAGNFLQRKKKVKDSPELLYQDMLKAGLGLNHPRLARMVAEKGAEAIDWTINFLGVSYLDRLDRLGGHSAARTVTTRSHSGVDIVKKQTAILKQMGVRIRTGCRMDKLLTDEKGALCGVKILLDSQFNKKNTDSKAFIRARKAVILASGGFGSDPRFRMLQNPSLSDSIASTNHPGATAEVLAEAFKKGAAPIHLSWIQTGPWGCSDEKGYGRGGRFASYSVFPRGIVVEPGGLRIINEWADRKSRSDAMLKVGLPCLGIVDSIGAGNDPETLAIGLKRGKIKKFDSITDLAKGCGVPAGRLEKTVSHYNDMIEKKTTDEFGKHLDISAYPISQPPFYCIRLQPKVHYTQGGVGIDSKARVIDIQGRPIPGLFAAGEVCGGIHGADRLGGCALVECIVFGRIAGQQASA